MSCRVIPAPSPPPTTDPDAAIRFVNGWTNGWWLDLFMRDMCTINMLYPLEYGKYGSNRGDVFMCKWWNRTNGILSECVFNWFGLYLPHSRVVYKTRGRKTEKKSEREQDVLCELLWLNELFSISSSTTFPQSRFFHRQSLASRPHKSYHPAYPTYRT